jgi:A/G-specific adenine glycosylase
LKRADPGKAPPGAVDEPGLEGSSPTAVIPALITWYGRHKRDLPWRGADPWAVLVSEIMLQQTPVNRVLPAYRAWVERWPTPGALAAASPGDVLVAWDRLGYPRRARNLHRAAQIVVSEHGGRVPSDLAALRALPGVGEYTARAVACFGFGLRHGVVDGNVRRVAARFLGGVADRPPSLRHVAEVEAVLPLEPDRAAVASAAFMEVGALLCRGRTPACAACPLSPSCRWRRAGFPAAAGPAVPRQARYEGSDRQARGALLAVLRSGRTLDSRSARAAVSDPARRQRSLGGLAADGLIVRDGTRWRLPGPGE